MSAKAKKKSKRVVELTPPESRSSEAITVAWTVSVTTLLFCNLAILGAHYYLASNPDAMRFQMMKEILLISGCGLGILSLALLPIVYRVRTVPPPSGFAVFGACLALGPLLAVVLRVLK
jgi:hypothetical protein